MRHGLLDASTIQPQRANDRECTVKYKQVLFASKPPNMYAFYEYRTRAT